MLKHWKAAALSAAMLAAPLAASATTVVTPGGSYDLLADDYFFNGDFDIGDVGTTYTFTFFNSSATSPVVASFGPTVLQVSAAFTGGVTFTFGSLAPVTIPQGDTDGYEALLTVAAGDSVDLIIDWGTVVDDGLRVGGLADVDFAVEAAVIPVPAAGVLLLSALGGLAVLRRRKSAA